MVSTIGIMVGFYIVTRMAEIISLDRSKTVRWFAYITLVVAVLSVISLVIGSCNTPGALR